MDTIFPEFGDAFSRRNGYQLSQTLSPELPNDMLQAIWRSTTSQDVRSMLKRGIQSSAVSPAYRLSKNETEGWVEVYYLYWKAVGELLAAQEQSSDKKVSQSLAFATSAFPTCSLIINSNSNIGY
jgi:hypothetical protein